MKDNLFSIVCVTYNQEKLITECLDSIAGQDYRQIELIVCDDCSTDRTVQVVEEWLEDHRDRFENIVFLKNEQNLGISATHDRGLRCAVGKYLKYIAGDDILSPNMANNVALFLKKSNCLWGQTLVVPFFDVMSNCYKYTLPISRVRSYFTFHAVDQFRMFCRNNFFVAPGNFFNRKALVEIGYLDVDFRSFEDRHTWLRLSKAGIKASLLPLPLVFWRRHNKSISYSAFSTGNTQYFNDAIKTLEKYVFPYINTLDWITVKHVCANYRYFKTLVELGGTDKAHRKARYEKLKDPLWWINSPFYFFDRFFQ